MARTILGNARVVLPVNGLLGIGYALLNRYPLFAPHLLPMTAVDSALSLMPWTVFPYFLLLFSDVLLPITLRDRIAFSETLRAYCVAMGLDAIVWVLYPTEYPRPEVVLEPSLASRVYAAMVSLDRPLCCLPSAHITIPAVGCWGLSREHPRKRILIWATFAVFSITILTTKQHYLADLVAGLLSAAIGIRISIAWSRWRPDGAPASEIGSA